MKFRNSYAFVIFYVLLAGFLHGQENITVFGGTGAVGSYFSLLLHKAGHVIHAIGSGKGSHFDAIRANGLKVVTNVKTTSEVITSSELIPPGVFERPDTKQDLILFTLKQPNFTETVASQAIGLSKPETVFGIVTNGLPFFFTNNFLDSIDPQGKLQKAFSDKCVIGVMPVIAANIVHPGEVTISRELSSIKVIIGEPRHRANCKSEAIGNIKKIFEQAGISTIWLPDGIQNEILKKEQFAITVNTLSAITSKPIDIVFEDPQYQPFLHYGVEVVNKLSLILGFGQLRSWTEFKELQITKGHLSSLARDLSEGRIGEGAAIVDAFLELAKNNGINNLAPLEKLRCLLAESANQRSPASDKELNHLMLLSEQSK